MSKRVKRQNRRTGRYRVSQSQKAIVITVMALMVAVAIFVIVSNSGSTSAVSNPSLNRLELDPIKGNPEAPVTIIEYGAYACPACRTWHQAGIIEQILATYPDQVRFIFRDYPVISPAYDRMAAEMAQCALDQSQEKFWAFHDVLYTLATPSNSQDDILRLGANVGLDATALRTCAESGIHRATVQYDEDRARNLGLPGTPSFLVNDIRIFNATPDVLQAAIEQALREHTG